MPTSFRTQEALSNNSLEKAFITEEDTVTELRYIFPFLPSFSNLCLPGAGYVPTRIDFSKDEALAYFLSAAAATQLQTEVLALKRESKIFSQSSIQPCTELAKKHVLGCVIPPTGAVARSLNLGHTFWANSVCGSRNSQASSPWAKRHRV